MTAPLLAMQGIDKSFSGVPALLGASLEVGRGEVHALIGQNGAGKSTLIKILTGAYRRDGGSVSFGGIPIEPSSPLDAQRLGISTIYQEINLVPFRSVAENVFLGREPKRWGLIDWGRIHRETERLLERLGIQADVRRPLGSYNIAIQQMVAIARALAIEAKLVVMDEPTSSLDEAEVGILFDVIRRLKSEGVSVIFVSHRLDELYAVCDRITIMRDGRTVASGSMAEFDKLALVAAMLGRGLSQVASQGTTGFDGRQGSQPGERDEALLSVAGLAAGRRVTDVSLQVRSGEIVGLAGLLGAGRTETARAVFGADPADGGRVSIAGKPALFKDPRAAIAAGIAFSSEDRKAEGIVPEMSVRENLTLALLPRLARMGVVDTAEQRRIVDRFIDRLSIKCTDPDQPIRELSGGNQQKVLLARWLCMTPRLLLLDEPTRGIDVGAKAEIQALIQELATQGLGVLMISSELEELIEGAARVFVLREGRTVAELSGDGLDEPAIMQAMAHG